MAIADDFTIDYVNQVIRHTSGTTVYTVNQLYTYTTVTFDDDLQMDDLPPMSAQTPTAFTMENGWFIDPVSTQFLNGGSLTTLGWNHSVSYPNGVRKKAYDASGLGTPFAAALADVGKTITETDTSQTGIILYYDLSLGAEAGYVWIRPTSVSDTFADVDSAYTTTGTGAGSFTAASTTGEYVWANIFTLGTLATNTNIYLYQNDILINSWWTDGHIDVLVLVQETTDPIDNGYVTIFARQYTKLYDHYAADLSAGARTPIPLATFDDSNNTTGDVLLNCSLGTALDDYQFGDIIGNNATQGSATALGVVTDFAGTDTDPDLTIYLIGDLTAFTASDTIWNYTRTGSADVDTVSVAGPADFTTPPTITFCDNVTNKIFNKDLNNDGTTQPYDVVIDCNQNSLADVYEYLKYVTRYGNTATLTGTGHSGEAYTAVGEIRLDYDNETVANFEVGETVTYSSGKTAIIGSLIDNGATGTMVLRDVTGSIIDNTHLTGVTSTAECDVFGTPSSIAPNKQSPFGSFAGGKFFGARGVWLEDYQTTESNNFQLIDSTNTTQIPPKTISLTVAGILSGDQVGVFLATGDNNVVKKDTYTIDPTTPTGAGVTSVRVNEVIPADTPYPSGFIRLVHRDASGIIESEEKLAYSTWSNSTQGSGYSTFTVTSFNSTLDSTDTAYVPYIDATAVDVSYSVSLTYALTSRYITCRVRRSGILPFMIKSSFADSNLTITAVRATDSIAPLGV